MNKFVLLATLKTIEKDITAVRTTDCLGSAKLAASRAAALSHALIKVLQDEEQQPFTVLRIVPLEDGQEGA